MVFTFRKKTSQLFCSDYVSGRNRNNHLSCLTGSNWSNMIWISCYGLTKNIYVR